MGQLYHHNPTEKTPEDRRNWHDLALAHTGLPWPLITKSCWANA